MSKPKPDMVFVNAALEAVSSVISGVVDRLEGESGDWSMRLRACGGDEFQARNLSVYERGVLEGAGASLVFMCSTFNSNNACQDMGIYDVLNVCGIFKLAKDMVRNARMGTNMKMPSSNEMAEQFIRNYLFVGYDLPEILSEE